MMKTKSSKKIICFLISSLIISFVLPMAALGDDLKIKDTEQFKLSKDEKIVFQKVEITDDKELKERAISGIIESSKVPIVKAVLKNKETNLESDVKTFTTVQKLRTVKNEKTNEVKKLYRLDSFQLYSLPKTTFGICSLSTHDDDWDATLSVLARTTAYYNEIVVSDYPYEAYKILYSTGKWTIYDYQASISDGTVGWRYLGRIYDASGTDYGHSGNADAVVYSYPTSGETYYDYHSMGWYCKSDMQPLDEMKAFTTITVTRGGSSWIGEGEVFFFE